MEERKSGFGIASFILGLIGALGGILVLPGVICGVLGIIFGLLSLSKKTKKGLSISGIILGLIGIIVSIVIMVSSIKYSNNIDLICGKSWIETHDDSYLVLNDDKSFKYYRNKDDFSDNYYEGTYEVYFGAKAVNYIADDLSKYNFTLEEQMKLLTKDNLKYYCCIVLNNEKCLINGKMDSKVVNKTPYYGWYDKDKEEINLINMNTGLDYNFKIDK